jgi:hypothetical protein
VKHTSDYHSGEKMSMNIVIREMKPQVTAEYIAAILWKRKIAKVSSITLLPQIKNNIITNIAYVEIESFCASPEAEDFIYHMTADTFVFCPDETALENMEIRDLWMLQKNVHDFGSLCVGPYTTRFIDEFFHERQYEKHLCNIEAFLPEPGQEPYPFLTFSERLGPSRDTRMDVDGEEEEYICTSKEWEDFINDKIQGLDNVYYTLDEAIARLWKLYRKFETACSEEEKERIEKECVHLEKQLKKYEDELTDQNEEDYYTNKTMGEICPTLFIPHSRNMRRECALNMDELPAPLSLAHVERDQYF